MMWLVNELHEEWNFKVFISTMARVIAFAATIILLVVGIYGALEPVNKAAGSQEQVFSNEHHAIARRMLPSTSGTKSNRSSSLRENDYGDGSDYGSGGNNNDDGSMNRIGIGAGCSKDNILVFQGPTSPLPNGIPTYTVEIQNVCASSISNIHLNCGWFSSARLINPKIFRRVGYDDCLVNNGEPLNPGETISFQYANTFQYPLQVSYVAG